MFMKGEKSRGTTHFSGKCTTKTRGFSAKPEKVHSLLENFRFFLTISPVLIRRLFIRPYRLQPVQAFNVCDKIKSKSLCDMPVTDMEGDRFLPRLIFSDEPTFHLSCKFHINIRVWKLEYPHQCVQSEIH